MKKFERGMLFFTYIFAVFIVINVYWWPIESPDLYWHLRMGLDLIEKGLSPFVDHYSYTYYGHPINYVAWPFQVLAAVFYKYFGGMSGVSLLRALFWLLPLPLLWLLGRRRHWSYYCEVLGILFYLCIVMWRNEPRPDMATAGFTFLLFLLIWDSPSQLNFKKLIPKAALLVIWTNFHISSIFGFVILGAYFADILIKLVLAKAPRKEQVRVIGLGIFCFAMGFLNHSLAHPVFAQMKVGSEWTTLIAEFRNVRFFDQDLFYRLYWVFLVSSIPYFFYRKMFMEALIVLVLGLKTWQMSRVLPQMVIVTLPCIISFTGLAFEQFARRSRFAFGSSVIILLATGVLLGDRLRINFKRINDNLQMAKEAGAFSPQDTAAYVKQKGLKGNILNPYNYGGYLLFSVAPEIKVFIDGRTNILYPVDHMLRWWVAQEGTAEFLGLLKDYPFDYALATPDDNTFEVAINSGEFGIEYVGRTSTLLRRHGGELPISSVAFVHPECLSPEHLEGLKKELKKVLSDFPNATRLREFLKTVTDFYEHPNNRELIEKSAADSVAQARLLAALALNEGKFDLAIEKYRQVYLSRPDRLFVANLLCQKRNCAGAEEFFDDFPPARRPNQDYVEAYQLLLEIKKKVGLKKISEQRLENLKNSLVGLKIEKGPPAIKNYCAFIGEHKQWH